MNSHYLFWQKLGGDGDLSLSRDLQEKVNNQIRVSLNFSEMSCHVYLIFVMQRRSLRNNPFKLVHTKLACNEIA